MGYSGDRHRDAKTISVEAKLPRVFRAIEIHRLHAEWREQERQHEAADRQRRWEAAMAEARRRYDEQARWPNSKGGHATGVRSPGIVSSWPRSGEPSRATGVPSVTTSWHTLTSRNAG